MSLFGRINNGRGLANTNANNNPGNKAVCQFYLEGRCRFGSECRNYHPPKDGNTNSRGGQLPYHLSAETIKLDLTVGDERPGWPLSAYGPGRDAPRQLLEGVIEQSPEELRTQCYLARAQGSSEQYEQSERAALEQANSRVQAVLNDLDGAVKYVIDGKDIHPNREDGVQKNAGNFPWKAKPMYDPNGSSSAGSTFGQNSNTVANAGPTSAFGQPSSFGQNSPFGANPSTQTAGSAFGQASSIGGGTSPFGAAKTSAFGSTSSLGGGGSAFGRPSILGGPAAGTASAFGQTSTIGGTSPFGSASGAGSSFGQTSALGASSPFGGANAATNSQGSAFGQASSLGGAGSAFAKPSAFASTNAFATGSSQPATAASNFGQASTLGQGQSTFGQPSAPGQAPSAFGQPSSLARNTTAFGQASTPGQAQPAFGQPSAAGQTTSVFGQPSGAGQTASAFGQPSAAPSPFGQTASNNASSSPFGQAANNTASTSSFGQAANSTTTASPFGAKSPFTNPTAPSFNKKASQNHLLFPNGITTPNADVEAADPSVYDGDNALATALKEIYLYVHQNGRFKDGFVPEVPPKREWVDWNF